MTHRKNYRNLDITGKKFGRLTAIEKVDGTRTQWLFKCDCGNIVTLPISRVLYRQQSCGCLRKEVAEKWVQSHTEHGLSKTTLYRKYRSMIERCERKDSWKYKRYGGRGIYVCEEWRNSFKAFHDWAYANGYNPLLDGRTEQSLDRIDNNGPYSPDNCRWATSSMQMKNRECTTLYPYKGDMYSASEFADKFGITSKSFVYNRLKNNHQTLEYILDDWNRIHDIPEHLIECSEYAQRKGVVIGSVNRMLREGRIKGEKVGRKWYVEKSELDKIP